MVVIYECFAAINVTYFDHSDPGALEIQRSLIFMSEKFEFVKSFISANNNAKQARHVLVLEEFLK